MALIPNPSDCTSYGIARDSIVGIRIEGHLIENPSSEMYDVGVYHQTCDREAFRLFREVNEEDLAVMAFELDYSQPNLCSVCGISITSPGAD